MSGQVIPFALRPDAPEVDEAFSAWEEYDAAREKLVGLLADPASTGGDRAAALARASELHRRFLARLASLAAEDGQP